MLIGTAKCPLLQETALQLVTSPICPRHLKTLRNALKERRNALAASVVKHFGDESLPPTLPGGLHLWVRLPDGVSDEVMQLQKILACGSHPHMIDSTRRCRQSCLNRHNQSFAFATTSFADNCLLGRISMHQDQESKRLKM